MEEGILIIWEEVEEEQKVEEDQMKEVEHVKQ